MLKLGDKCKQVHYINLPVFNMFGVFHSYLFILFYYKKIRGEFPHKHSEFGFSGRERAACSNQLEVRSVVGRHLPPRSPVSSSLLLEAGSTLCPRCLPQPPARRFATFLSLLPASPHRGAGSKEPLALLLFFTMFFSQIFFLCQESFLVPREPRILKLKSMR